ncbi:MAG: hypothetical protein JJU29_07265 [Verrucomicrobia bacterium]|nr:hypothetical protein [Verrucomicrobiota bacterium]MCH8512218.1 hypothetical protein [Kiritimatiellia bacterium]
MTKHNKDDREGANKRRLIEADFPFAELSRIAERESWRKEVYRPVYYIHKWWARRLGSVFRGVLLGACLDEDEDFWSRFYGHNDLDETVIFDPFMGSGVTIGEAIKLGCTALGQDINPVAYLACKAAFTKYNLPEVLDTYQNLERTVSSKILSYFETRTDNDEQATVLYYFLVKVVSCPECNKEIDLFKSRIFSKNAIPRKDPSARSVCPGCNAINITQYDADSVFCPECSRTYNPQEGNITGAKVKCDDCGHQFRLVDRMSSLCSPLGYRRYAKMVLTSAGQKRYASMNSFDDETEIRIKKEFSALKNPFPETEITSGHNTNQILKHNYRFWHELFSDRQLLCIYHLQEAIRNINNPDHRLLFACLFSGVLEFNNLFASFKGEGTGAVRHMFSHHVLKPEMMPIEANMWGTRKSSGSFSTLFRSRILNALAYKADPTELLLNSGMSHKIGGINRPLSVKVSKDFALPRCSENTAFLRQGDSSCTNIPDNCVDVVVTDPPFFDNVHYSELADFFYYWINQIIGHSDAETTRQEAEVQDTNPLHFTNKLTSVFAECNRVLKKAGVLVFTYHHSRHEGWTSVHRAIRHAGFVCTQAYPIKAEMSVSMPLKQAKSPIHLDLILLCKKDHEVDEQHAIPANIQSATLQAQDQVSALKSNDIAVSLGDAKVILMGRLLCEAHRMMSLEDEERFLSDIEKNIDSYVADVIETKGEVLYKQNPSEQLVLFEKMANYLANNAIHSNRDSATLHPRR